MGHYNKSILEQNKQYNIRLEQYFIRKQQYFFYSITIYNLSTTKHYSILPCPTCETLAVVVYITLITCFPQFIPECLHFSSLSRQGRGSVGRVIDIDVSSIKLSQDLLWGKPKQMLSSKRCLNRWPNNFEISVSAGYRLIFISILYRSLLYIM